MYKGLYKYIWFDLNSTYLVQPLLLRTTWQNLRLQGLSATIFKVQDTIKAMIKKLELSSVCVNKDNTQVFPSLHNFFVCKLTQAYGQRQMWYSEAPDWVGYFPETDDTNNWISYPFHALPPVHLPISEQESLIKIATRSYVKIKFYQKPLPDFWIGLCSSYLGKSRW